MEEHIEQMADLVLFQNPTESSKDSQVGCVSDSFFAGRRGGEKVGFGFVLIMYQIKVF
jgi:hypothetical protein